MAFLTKLRQGTTMATRKDISKEEERTPGAAVMVRSRGQLSTSYAPGAIFTFEGGLGACLSVPENSRHPSLARVTDETATQIHLRLREIWQSWFVRAMEGGTADHPVLPTQCLDFALIRGGERFQAPPKDQFELVDPRVMGYIPAPLDFVCNTCKRFRKYSNVKDAGSHLDELSTSRCDSRDVASNGKCRWRQLDVIFVHWSGSWIPPTPGRWEWSVERSELSRPIQACTTCQSEKFYLIDSSPRIGEWVFECENGHKDGDSWLQNDPMTTELLGDLCVKRPPRWRRMEPISYRAAAAYYPHSEQFVVFAPDQRDMLLWLQDGYESELAHFLSDRYKLGAKTLTTEEILEVLRKSGHDAKVELYEFTAKIAEQFKSNPDMHDEAVAKLRSLIDDWRSTPGLLPAHHECPKWLSMQIARRHEFGSKYDPLLLAVEHEAIARSKLRPANRLEGRSSFVRFSHPDRDLAPKAPADARIQSENVATLQKALGLSEIGLIREFDLCRFSHGFTRMSTDPLIEKSGQWLPVRLNLFPEMRNGKIPIYVVTQSNEAIYVRLNASAVHAWLCTLEIPEVKRNEAMSDSELGAMLLESAAPFGKYFTELKPREANAYCYVYTLLHTYSHVLMRSISEFSGLDNSSLSEYIFPSDLAFVVYRNGTTMDLGNLSALWRNYNTVFLESMLHARTMMCGSGSLCDSSGGACPSCIVMPETSCIAANQLLCRSVLRTGIAPREDLTHRDVRISGYFDVCSGLGNDG